ncbi:MAG: hypothetical protein AUK44_08075 [Porphyromonadaceae bacterium CG2_30_38_12]|nr:MAG: hypothetical protein AUK44_08075 [Porphyromonadaceae bacterium CG2_30_38_12]
MKRIFLAAILLPFVWSCSSNSVIQNTSTVKIATVENPSAQSTFFLNLDDSTRLWVLTNDLKYYRPEDGQRVIAEFDVLSTKAAGSSYQYDVKLNDVYEILTKGIFNVTAATKDSIGNDPIAISNMWVAADYLNVEFIYPGYNKTHYINLVNDTSKVYSDGKIHLDVRHNANNDYPSVNIRGIVSFNLKTLQTITATTVNLVIHTNEFNQTSSNEGVYNFTYKYAGGVVMNTPEKLVNKPSHSAKIK